MYEMKNQIGFTDSSADGTLKLYAAVGMMMNCCQFQEYQEKEFCKYLRENGIAVFLFSMQLDIIRMPRFRENVSTAVKIYGCQSIYGLRRITMRDEEGNLCLISNATGAFFDMKAGKALKLDVSLVPLKFDEPEPMECLPRKIGIPADGGIALPPAVVTPSGLDPNGHLTSHVYFAIAQDALESGYTFNRIRTEYKKQAKCGETITPFRYDCGNGKVIVDMRGEDGRTFAAAEFSTADVTAQL